MLKIISNRKSEKATLLVAVLVVSSAVLVSANVLSYQWTVSLCDDIAVADYSSNVAPAKCKTLWQEGKI